MLVDEYCQMLRGVLVFDVLGDLDQGPTDMYFFCIVDIMCNVEARLVEPFVSCWQGALAGLLDPNVLNEEKSTISELFYKQRLV